MKYQYINSPPTNRAHLTPAQMKEKREEIIKKAPAKPAEPKPSAPAKQGN